MKFRHTISLVVFFSATLTSAAVQAQDASRIECISKYTQLGISPDAALAECRQIGIGDCIKNLLQKKVVVNAISKDQKQGYLIDLGDNESRWLEGPSWKEKGCLANTNGPYKRQSDEHQGFFTSQRSFEWFRQGWCSQQQIVLEQNYSPEEAKILCEAGYSPESNPTNIPEVKSHRF